MNGQGGEWLGNATVWTGIGGIVAWVGGVVWKALGRKDNLAERRLAREDRLQAHNSALAIELLQITKSEAESLRHQLADLQQQVGELPQLERRLVYFEESLEHIGALLDPDIKGREAAEHAARKFLARMIALREAKGIAANRAQAAQATSEQIQRVQRKRLREGDGE